MPVGLTWLFGTATWSHGSLRDWTLPVSPVWDRRHHRNQMPAELFQHFDADNWAPLYGADEFVPTTSND